MSMDLMVFRRFSVTGRITERQLDFLFKSVIIQWVYFPIAIIFYRIHFPKFPFISDSTNPIIPFLAPKNDQIVFVLLWAILKSNAHQELISLSISHNIIISILMIFVLIN
jgi:hypothetical protein